MAKPSPATSRQTANPPARRTAATPLRQPADTPLDFILWDDEVPSLGLRNRLGVQSWLVQTRIGAPSPETDEGGAEDGVALGAQHFLVDGGTGGSLLSSSALRSNPGMPSALQGAFGLPESPPARRAL